MKKSNFVKHLNHPQVPCIFYNSGFSTSEITAILGKAYGSEHHRNQKLWSRKFYADWYL